jgi:ATP-dependent exoDNAse (exonuclease V) beta subunit
MISDLAARQQALDPQKSFIVQAPAGSGKTGLLVYRMLTLLATVEKPQQVLAITFTRKATAEMRERLLELMECAEQGHRSDDAFEQQGIDLASAVLLQDQRHQWRLLDAPHQLQILTNDSFCAKLTGSMPWLSRLGDKPRTTDQADVHYAAAIEQLFNELLDPNSPIALALKTVLLELDFNYNKARTLFASMLAKRDQWLRHLLQHNLAELRPHLEAAWQDVVHSQIQSITDCLPSNTIEELCLLAQYADANLTANGKASALGVFKDYVNADELPVEKLSADHWRALCHLLLTGEKLRKTVSITQGFIAKAPNTVRMKALLAEFADDTVLLAA